MSTLGPERCRIDQVEFEQRAPPYEFLLDDVLSGFPEVQVFDPKTLFCDGKFCWVIRNGVPLYWNSDHLTLEGADMVIEHLFGN